MLNNDMPYKSRRRRRDEVHLPFVPQGDAANKCDATGDATSTSVWYIKTFLSFIVILQF